jgi:wyosine [tRNA(Phe)-imidazoG37] synthetase (radical SAM superfamily)
VATEKIIGEIDQYFSNTKRLDEIDVVTITACGEPTLHAGFGKIIAHLKEKTGKPIAVLTNGTTLSDIEIRQELSLADVVIPSLDSGREKSFRKIDRPAVCLDFDKISKGLIAFSHEFSGKLWLEILFSEGINDSNDDLGALQKVIKQMCLDRIQLNTVARPPLESFAKAVSESKMNEIADYFTIRNPGVTIDILAGGASPKDVGGTEDTKMSSEDMIAEIIQMLKRRPCTAADINKIFHCGGSEKVERCLDPLIKSGDIYTSTHDGRTYYLL